MEEETRVLERILHGAEEPRDLPLALLKSITNDFSEGRKIGQGGFGEVFKGELRNKVVAVKRMYVNEHTIDDKAFRREIKSLMNTKHGNVVRFLGFCSHTHREWMKHAESGEWNLVNINERLLCSEYIGNGSLDKHITDELGGLEWETRYKIITGICKGLKYLHEDRNIIHMDLKPQNILLDHDMVPKITDFGLSRPNKESHTMGLRFGTQGYFAPEYGTSGKTSLECDIYSLGTIIIELVTGCIGALDKNNVLRRWRQRWNNPPTPRQYQQVNGCIDIAVCCNKQNPEARPSIKEIIDLLNEITKGHTGQASQISPCLDEDDMLRINPLELRLPSELKNEISRSIELMNDTCKCIAFNIKLPRARCIVQPDKGTVRPKSKYSVKITVQAGDVQRNNHADKFIVHSMQVQDSDGLRDEDVTERMFEKTSKFVDKVDLMIVYEPQENFKPRGETNIPDQEVPKEKKRKTVESAPREEKNKLGSGDNTEGTSIDTSSSAQGQYTKQIDHYNFHPPEYFSRRRATNMTYLLNVSDRAIDVTRGAMGNLLHKLGELHMEFNLERSVKKDAEKLMKMQQVLRKVSYVQQANLDDLVKRWANNVREMSYDLEDFVDGFLVHSESDSNVRELAHEMCFLLENGKSQQPIGDLIKHHISKRVQDAAKTCEELKVDNIVANATTKADIEDPRISGIYIHREHLIGIEAPKKELISLLEEDGDKSKLKIVSIFGLGGLGKTTLAHAVYDKLKANHDTSAFISVGRNPNVKEVLENILFAFGYNFKAEKLDVWLLRGKLNEYLENKRYFIVIDDLWDLSTWDAIQSAFTGNECGSRVLTTTRIHSVALGCCNSENKYVYRMKQLSDKDSEDLFLRRIFGSKKCYHFTLRKEQISKCNDLTIMEQILDLSYIHLPDHLKTCLLYVCMYPEDRDIDTNELLRKWVAEGFVPVSRNGVLHAEDVAEQYLEELINMCMIQPKWTDYNNEVLTCRVHDIILDLMRAKSSKFNFSQVIDALKEETWACGEIRRVSVQYNCEEDSRFLPTIKGSLKHVRSVLIYQSSLASYFLEFKYVRVLHLEHKSYCEGLDLTGISNLFFLRYIKIVCSIYSEGELKLPDQIGQLQHLETIDLKGSTLKNYPSDIVTLPLLSHLRYRGSIGIMLPEGFERLKSRRTLEGVCVLKSSVETIKGLGELTNLRNLGFNSVFTSESDEVASAHMNALHSSISRLSTSLRIFTLEGHELFTSSRTPFHQGSSVRKLDIRLKRCPEWIGQLHYLYSLSISVSEVADGLTIVEGLPSLAFLSVHVDDICDEKNEESVVISGGRAFQALKHLVFSFPKALLTFEKGALPKLEILDIRFSHHTYRRILPAIGIEHLPAPTLKKIVVTLSKEEYDHDWLFMLEGSQSPDDCDSEDSNKNCYDRLRKLRHLVRSALKEHHPEAAIYIYFCEEEIIYYEGSDEEDSDDEEERCSEEEDDEREDCCRGEDDDADAYQVSGSQTSAQAQANTSQVELIEARKDSAVMRTNTDAPPTTLMVSEGRQSGHTEDMQILRLPFTNPVAPSPSSLQQTVVFSSQPDIANMTNIDLNQVPNELDDEDFLWIDADLIELMKGQASDS